MYKTGKFDFHEPPPDQQGKVARRRVSQEIRNKIRSWREKRLSAGEITQLLSQENIKISIRTVERVLAEEGFEKPAFLITNDFASDIESIVGHYARRWRVENGIAEAVKFFHLNSLSSPILTKIHFDVALTMIADTLYTMLARKLRGFEDCDAYSFAKSVYNDYCGAYSGAAGGLRQPSRHPPQGINMQGVDFCHKRHLRV